MYKQRLGAQRVPRRPSASWRAVVSAESHAELTIGRVKNNGEGGILAVVPSRLIQGKISRYNSLLQLVESAATLHLRLAGLLGIGSRYARVILLLLGNTILHGLLAGHTG